VIGLLFSVQFNLDVIAVVHKMKHMSWLSQKVENRQISAAACTGTERTL